MPLVFGLGLMVGVYYLVKLLFNKPNLALFSMGLIALNPWAIFVTRTGYESPVALCLYVWSFVFLTLFFKRKSKKPNPSFFWLIPWFLTFALGFFTYHGLKISGALLTIVLTGYLLYQSSQGKPLKDKKQLLCTGGISLLVMSMLIINIISLTTNGVRTNEISLFAIDKFNFISNE